MSSSLKNVSVGDLEKAIAEALQKFCDKDKEFTVSIGSVMFDRLGSQAEMSLKAWERSKEEDPLDRLM